VGFERPRHNKEDPLEHAIGEKNEFRFLRLARSSKVNKLIKSKCGRRAENENHLATKPRCL
jgi:hypothetical protein